MLTQQMAEAAGEGDWERVELLRAELAEEVARTERQGAEAERRIREGAAEPEGEQQ